MSDTQDPIFERTLGRRLEEDEGILSRKSRNRQGAEDREGTKRVRMERLRGALMTHIVREPQVIRIMCRGRALLARVTWQTGPKLVREGTSGNGNAI